MAMPFREQFANLREVEESKNTLVENMLREIDELNMTLKDTDEALEREKDTSRLYQQRSKEFEMSLKNMQRATDSNAFVLVLIDGDCMNFLDDLINRGELGGQEAAQRLRNSVLDYVRNQRPGLDHEPEVVVQVYGNLRGLTKIYCDSSIIQQREDLDRFVRGFNMSHALFNIIDAGNGKECSDSKIREVLMLNKGNVHCKHIIFGGSSDNGYARLLGPLSGADSMRGRLTMLEGPPFAPELQRLVNKFSTTAFPSVFRNSKIESRSTSYAPVPAMSNAPKMTAPPVPPGLPVPSSATPSSNYTAPPPPSTYAATAASFQPRSPTTNNHVHPVAETKPIPDGFIARNASDQRVDPPLKASSAVVNMIKPRKMCNNYHLRNYCGNPRCTYEHGDQLGTAEKDALRFLARQVPCGEGIWCWDEYCLFGHRCTNGIKCNKYNCRFSEEMHGVDETIVNL